ncbi:MAG: hypothetical protein ACHQ4F_11155 [Candidatus Dormibacteria bacterium]
MNETQLNEKRTDVVIETPRTTEVSETDNEFKVAVRKLEMPVRPRGVLAE